MLIGWLFVLETAEHVWGSMKRSAAFWKLTKSGKHSHHSWEYRGVAQLYHWAPVKILTVWFRRSDICFRVFLHAFPHTTQQETYHFGMGCLQQGRQHHEKPQSKCADQEKSVQWVCAPGYDIWKWNLGLTTAQVDALAVAQRKMKRIILGITLRDQRHNTWIRQQTGVTDITDHIRQSKHRWAGHVARLQDNRWTIRATSWVPRRWLRPRGRLKTRWER